jgi:hypothetical protein
LRRVVEDEGVERVQRGDGGEKVPLALSRWIGSTLGRAIAGLASDARNLGTSMP